jgi:hypothetical protein
VPGGPQVGILGVASEGLAIDASLSVPNGLCFDAKGDLYIADSGNYRILKVTQPDDTAEPRFSTYAGVPLSVLIQQLSALEGKPPEIQQDGTPALQAVIPIPLALYSAPNGDLYFSEAGTANLGRLSAAASAVLANPDSGVPVTYPRIRKVAADGGVYTIIGPQGRYFRDPLSPDALSLPLCLEIDASGRLVIVDSAANQIRFLAPGSF